MAETSLRLAKAFTRGKLVRLLCADIVAGRKDKSTVRVPGIVCKEGAFSVLSRLSNLVLGNF